LIGRGRHSDRPGLLRVVHKVALSVQIRVLADDLHRVLIGPHGAIGPQAVEQRTTHVRFVGVELGIILQTGMGHVVDDADRKVVLGLGRIQLVQHRLDHRRREFLGRQAVATPDDQRQLGAGTGSLLPAFDQGRQNILVQRFARPAGFFGAIEHSDALDRRRDRGQTGGDVERAEQPHFEDTHLLAHPIQFQHRLLDGSDAGAHQHDDAVGISRPHVVEQMILPPNQFGETVHRLLDDRRRRIVERVAGFAGLEEYVGILRRAPQHGPIRVHRAVAVILDQLLVDHRQDIVVAQQLDLVHLVRRAEAVEEVQERHARFERRRLGNQRHIVGFAHRTRGQHGPARTADRHHVAVIAKNGQRVGGQRPSGDVEHRRRQLAGNLEHVGDHQQQALRSRERGRQGPCLDRPVTRARRATFALHFDHVRHDAEHILAALRGPFVGELAHIRRRSDRIDRDHLVRLVGDV